MFQTPTIGSGEPLVLSELFDFLRFLLLC